MTARSPNEPMARSPNDPMTRSPDDPMLVIPRLYAIIDPAQGAVVPPSRWRQLFWRRASGWFNFAISTLLPATFMRVPARRRMRAQVGRNVHRQGPRRRRARGGCDGVHVGQQIFRWIPRTRLWKWQNPWLFDPQSGTGDRGPALDGGLHCVWPYLFHRQQSDPDATVGLAGLAKRVRPHASP